MMNMMESIQLDTALTHALNGRPDRSEAILRQMSPMNLRAQFNLGWHDLRHGRFRSGMERLASGRLINVFGSPPLQNGRPLWSPDLRARTVLLQGEGGLGDEILNWRWAQHLKARGARTVVAGVSAALWPLARAVPGIDAIVERSIAGGVDVDAWVPAMSASVLLDLDSPAVAPYLAWPTPLDLPDHRPRIGLRWAGSHQFEHQQHRRFPIELMLDLVGLVDAEWLSFQRDLDLVPLPEAVRDLSGDLKTWADTATHLAGLDLLITSCTSVAHCAAAMGVETWIVVPACAYYPWAVPGERSEWYPSVRLFRQGENGDWSPAFRALRAALVERHSERRVA